MARARYLGHRPHGVKKENKKPHTPRSAQLDVGSISKLNVVSCLRKKRTGPAEPKKKLRFNLDDAEEVDEEEIVMLKSGTDIRSASKRDIASLMDQDDFVDDLVHSSDEEREKQMAPEITALQFGKGQEPDAKKSRKEIYEEVIKKSKKEKAKKAEHRAAQEVLLEELEEGLKDVMPELHFKTKAERILGDDDDEGFASDNDDFKKLMTQMKASMVERASSRIPTAPEVVRKAKLRMEEASQEAEAEAEAAAASQRSGGDTDSTDGASDEEETSEEESEASENEEDAPDAEDAEPEVQTPASTGREPDDSGVRTFPALTRYQQIVQQMLPSRLEDVDESYKRLQLWISETIARVLLSLESQDPGLCERQCRFWEAKQLTQLCEVLRRAEEEEGLCYTDVLGALGSLLGLPSQKLCETVQVLLAYVTSMRWALVGWYPSGPADLSPAHDGVVESEADAWATIVVWQILVHRLEQDKVKSHMAEWRLTPNFLQPSGCPPLGFFQFLSGVLSAARGGCAVASGILEFVKYRDMLGSLLQIAPVPTRILVDVFVKPYDLSGVFQGLATGCLEPPSCLANAYPRGVRFLLPKTVSILNRDFFKAGTQLRRSKSAKQEERAEVKKLRSKKRAVGKQIRRDAQVISSEQLAQEASRDRFRKHRNRYVESVLQEEAVMIKKMKSGYKG